MQIVVKPVKPEIRPASTHAACDAVIIQVLTIPTISNTSPTNDSNKPKTTGMLKGAVEKATMPSIEYKNNFQNDQAVVPAARYTFSYSIYLVLYPTQLNIPFEKRLYSLI